MSQYYKKLNLGVDVLINEEAVTSINVLKKLPAEQVITKDLINIISDLGLRFATCVIIPYVGERISIIHIDEYEIRDQASLNFVIDRGHAFTNWYKENEDCEPTIRTNAVAAKTLSYYDLTKITLVESEHIKESHLFQSGVPHNVSNLLEDRWCVSIKLRHQDWSVVTWDQAILLFQKYIVNN